MTNEEYQLATAEFAVYPSEKFLPYLVLGLASEAGEVAGKLKKVLCGDYGDGSDDARMDAAISALHDEVGDCLWYISQWCNECEISMSDLMERNITKLRDRAERNVIKGSGDER